MKVCEFDAHPHQGACIWWAGAEMEGAETGRNRSNGGANACTIGADNEVTPATLATPGGPASPSVEGASNGAE